MGDLKNLERKARKKASGVVKAVEKGANDVSKATKKAANDVAKTVDKAVKDVSETAKQAGKDLGTIVEKAGKDIGRTFDKAVDDLNVFLRDTEVEFCNLMTGGAYGRGEAGCSASGGVGHDKDGTYTYDPMDPDTKYRGNETSKPTDNSYQNFADFIEAHKMHYYEYEFNDVYGIQRFLPGEAKLGNPWPTADGEILPPTTSGTVRGNDSNGGGAFLARRWDEKTKSIRFHGGIDYLANPGEPVRSPINGHIERMKNPGKPGLTGVLIRSPSGYTASVFYVKPDDAIMERLRRRERVEVRAGSRIGSAQDIRAAYGDIRNHVHVTLEDSHGGRISPDGKTTLIKQQTRDH